MKSKKPARKLLYEKYLSEQQEEEERENLGEELGVAQERIVVKKVSTFAKVMEIVEDAFFQALKVGFYLIVMALSSLGLTVLMNSELRNMVINALSSYLK